LFTMKAYINAQKIAVLADKSYYYATKREGEHMSSAYVAPNEFYQVMSLIVDEILQRNLEHTNEILAKFIDRHFSFSRTKNFSLNIKAEQQQQWIEALGDFILRVPKEVDALVNAATRPLLYYARQKDFDHYQIVEESYRNGHYYN
ncbi:glycosyltransferase family 2 protein, partial [Staphylococcus cohnii]